MKKIYIFVGSYIGKENYNFLFEHYYKKQISVSNSEFERMLFESFNINGADSYFIGAPSVGRFPFSCKKMFYKKRMSGRIRDCSFCTIIGFSNISKSFHLKKEIESLLKEHKNDDIYIVGCEAHKPYLDVIKFVKRKHCGAKSLLVVPDDPLSMVFSRNFIYKILKRRNVKHIHNISEKYVDSYLYFTKTIGEKFTFEKPYLVREGIIEKFEDSNPNNKKIICTYIGKVDERNGIPFIIEAAKKLKNFDFEVYGSGDYEEKISSINLKNLHFYGFVNPGYVDKIMKTSDIFLSPRKNDLSYTSYSFPSKILKYISYCKPIVTFKLPCYSSSFDQILIYPEDETVDSFVNAIKLASKNRGARTRTATEKYLSYLLQKNMGRDLLSLLDTIKKVSKNNN